MTTVTVNLPDSVFAFVKQQAEKGGFESEGEYVTSIVSQAQLLSALEATEQQLIQGLDSGDSRPLTPADWESLKRRVWERDAANQANQSP